jgi:hypothetical protein
MGCWQLQPDINESHFGHFDMPRPAGGGLLGLRSSFQAHDAPMALLRSIVTVVAAKHQPIPDRCCLPRLFSSSAEDDASQPGGRCGGYSGQRSPALRKTPKRSEDGHASPCCSESRSGSRFPIISGAVGVGVRVTFQHNELGRASTSTCVVTYGCSVTRVRAPI